MFDQLEGGKYDNPNEQLKKQAQSTPTTNADAERDFGMLDRLEKLKPKVLDMTVEGIIMYQRNKTSDWGSNLSEDKLKKGLECARKSKTKQKNQFRERMAEIHRTLVMKME